MLICLKMLLPMKKSTKKGHNPPSPPGSLSPTPLSGRYDTVTIGVSSGGMDALSTLLPLLPVGMPQAFIVVQHVHPTSDNYLVEHLNRLCRLPVKEAEEKEPVMPGTIYVAPPNYHLLIEDNRTFSLSTSAKVNYSRPSIDVLFETAAEVYQEALIGIILTGANNDGSRGLKTIKEFGGLVIVQDPATAEVMSMPLAALETVDADYILSLPEIGQLLSSLHVEHVEK